MMTTLRTRTGTGTPGAQGRPPGLMTAAAFALGMVLAVAGPAMAQAPLPPGAGGGSGERYYEMMVDGVPGTMVEARCRTGKPDEAVFVVTPPQRLGLSGVMLQCQFRQTTPFGQAVIVVRHPGGMARVGTGGPGSTATLSLQ